MNFLADIPFSAGELYAFAGIVVFVLTAAVSIKKLTDRNPPLHREFTSREEHLALKSQVEGLSEEIKEGFIASDKKRSTSIAGLHELSRLQGADLARNTQKTDMVHAQVQVMDAKIDRVLERLPRRSPQ